MTIGNFYYGANWKLYNFLPLFEVRDNKDINDKISEWIARPILIKKSGIIKYYNESYPSKDDICHLFCETNIIIK